MKNWVSSTFKTFVLQRSSQKKTFANHISNKELVSKNVLGTSYNSIIKTKIT